MILVFAGVQADLRDRLQPRLPSRAEAPLRRRLTCLLLRSRPRLAVGALASGSDIIVAEAALAAGVQLKVLLPFDVPAFEMSSIRAHGGEWVARFNALLTATGPPLAGTLDPADPTVFTRHNQVLLERARAWAIGSEPVRALAIRPATRGLSETTDDFAERCGPLSIPLWDIDPLAERDGGPFPVPLEGCEPSPKDPD